MSTSRVFPLLTLAVLIAGCSSTAPEAGLQVSTNKAEYEVGEGFNLRVVNLSASNAWLETSCGGRLRFELERRQGWHWELWVPVNECTDRHGIAALAAMRLPPSRETWESGFWTVPPGRYRVRVLAGRSAEDGSVAVFSNEFTVE